MPFPTLQTSDPRFTPPGITHITVKTPALGGRADVTVYVPRGYENRVGVPMVILLHGIYASHWAWTMSIGAHLIAQKLIDSGEIAPMALVMPSDGLWGDGTGYIPHPNANYEMWIVNDVPAVAVQAIPSLAVYSPVFIAGLSMGGFGALRLGAKYPDRFAAISAHSAVTDLAQLTSLVTPTIPTGRVDMSDRGSGLYWLVENRDRLPPVRFDCGREDELIYENRQLHAALDYYEVPHTYEEFDGGHDTAYWSAHIADTLRFFSGILRAQ
ncbi:MAG: alpha/beta hydrolase-fold protein [Anaerolineae bacterium]